MNSDTTNFSSSFSSNFSASPDRQPDQQPWFAELETLKQQLQQAQALAQRAQDSADRWRQLYTQEAAQRRSETEANQAQLQVLKAELAQLKQIPDGDEIDDQRAEFATLSIEELQERLQTLSKICKRLECDRAELQTALDLERAEHTKTRSDLTAALGDTVEVFARTKQRITQLSQNPSLNIG